MFYRRKILLALLEIFGGSLTKMDCQKLLLLFCERRSKNYYDFFPHKYGNFSLIASQDRHRLTDLGFLTADSDFQLARGHSYVSQLKPNDRTALDALLQEVGDKRGEELIHKLYLEFPHYTARSQIVKKLLSAKEYELVSRSWQTATEPCLFTIGYEGLSIDAYLDMLVSSNVKVLVDVRKNPLSMKYGFSKTKLAEYTGIAGLDYIHIPELGIESRLRKDLKSPEDYQKLFDFYYSHILPEQEQSLERLQSIIQEYKRVAITCFEADHQFCHRHKVAMYLANDPSFSTPVVHLGKQCVCTI